MFAIQCTNKLYSYNRYVGLKASGKPQIVYEGSSKFPAAIKEFDTNKSAEKFLIKLLTREGVDFEPTSTADIIDFALITNSTEFKIIECNIQDNKLEIINSYSFNANKYISGQDE